MGLPLCDFGIKPQIIILNQKKTTMKKFLAIAMIAATLTSCGGGETKEETPAADTTAVAPAPAETTAPAADTTAKVDTAAKAAADTTKK